MGMNTIPKMNLNLMKAASCFLKCLLALGQRKAQGAQTKLARVGFKIS